MFQLGGRAIFWTLAPSPLFDTLDRLRNVFVFSESELDLVFPSISLFQTKFPQTDPPSRLEEAVDRAEKVEFELEIPRRE
jgi:hypothetical protein